jgi:hypothetical protein
MIRERLGLDPGDRAGLMDALAGLAAWSIEQASRGLHIIATEDVDAVPGEELRDPALTRLRESRATVEAPVVRLSRDEAERLYELLSEPVEVNEEFAESLRRAFAADRVTPDLDWSE